VTDLERFWDVYQDTAPEKLTDMKDEPLQACYRYFLAAHGEFGAGYTKEIRTAEARIALLQSVIESRRMEKQNADQHEESMGQGSKILLWTKRAVAVGVLVPILVALIAEIPFSRLLPSKASQASPASSPQAAATVSPSPAPMAAESPSESRQRHRCPQRHPRQSNQHSHNQRKAENGRLTLLLTKDITKLT
jgi:hypothetical protein